MLIKELLVKEVPGLPKTIQALSSPLVCPPQLDSKILLLKTTYFGSTVQSNNTGTELEDSPCWIPFIIPKGSMQATEGERSYPSVNPTNYETSYRVRSPTCTTVPLVL